MNRDKFLTKKLNNIISLVLGLPALAFIILALTTSLMLESTSFIGLVLIGVLYWVIVEGHTNMRFAWQRKKLADENNEKRKTPNPLIYIPFNAIWWIPIILTFVGVIDYDAGFVSFSLITLARLISNIYRNNLLPLEHAERFPFRS